MNEFMLLEKLSTYGEEFMEALIFADQWGDMPRPFFGICKQHGLVNKHGISTELWWRISLILDMVMKHE
jgi:hypothetical protein